MGYPNFNLNELMVTASRSVFFFAFWNRVPHGQGGK